MNISIALSDDPESLAEAVFWVFAALALVVAMILLYRQNERIQRLRPQKKDDETEPPSGPTM